MINNVEIINKLMGGGGKSTLLIDYLGELPFFSSKVVALRKAV